MACTLLRIVQAAVNLRRRFECAIQSSFESVESGEVLDDHAHLGDTEDNGEDVSAKEEDVSTSEHLSQNFQLSFADDDNDSEHGDNTDEKTIEQNTESPDDGAQTSNKMTFIHSDDQKDSEDKENGAYRDAKTSSSIEILEENVYATEDVESGDELDSPTTENETVVEESVTENVSSKENESTTENVQTTENQSAAVESTESGTEEPTKENIETIVVPKVPIVQVNEISGSDRSSSERSTTDSDTDSRCSIKSVRLRYAEAVSPSSGCKPPKIIKSDASLDTSEGEPENDQQWILLVKESGHQLVKESEKENSNSESEVDKKEFLAYADWLLKGKDSEEAETSSSDEQDVLYSPSAYEGAMGEEDIDIDEDSEIYLEDDDDEDVEYDDEMIIEESFDESFVDDGFVSLDIDEFDDDVIIEENESDLEKERLEEELLEEMRKSFEEGPGRAEAQEHRKLSRQYSPAIYLADPLPGIPESKVVIEAKEEGTGRPVHVILQIGVVAATLAYSPPPCDGVSYDAVASRISPDSLPSGCPFLFFPCDMWWCCSLFNCEKAGLLRAAAPTNLWNLASNPLKNKKDTVHPENSALKTPNSFCDKDVDDRSVRGSKKSLRSPPVQRQRCVQLEGGEGDDEGAGGRPPRPVNQSSEHRVDPRDIVLEVEPIRVTTSTPSPEVPLVVVATAEGGTRTHALHRLRGRSSHQPSYTHSASSGDPLPKTHTYHKYASASFDLAKSNRHEGARAAFHTSRSSFEGDRRLSLSASGGGGGRGACESIGLTPPTFDKSPGSARHLPSMEGGSRPCSSGSNSERTVEGLPRSGFRRSRSERVGGSPASVSPARSESLRVSRTRSHHQDVEMTELCSPRRLSPYDDYRHDALASSRISPDTSPTTIPTGGEATTVLSTSSRYTSWRSVSASNRRQSSLESGELEDLMENRRNVEQRRLRLQADSTTPSDEDEEPRSKIRYNDMGSLEQVNEEMADLLDDSSVASSDNHEKIKVQCRALWQLRATFEEEDPDEPDSDSGRMEILSSPEHHSPDQENLTSATSHTTSFESNTDAIVAGEPGGAEPSASEGLPEGDDTEAERSNEDLGVTHPPITLPSSEARRTSYRAILANRLKQIDAGPRPPLSSENSFDSVDTECSSTTDLSRAEVLTTSFDSTTDCPTDSTSDTHSHRLQQMKADSGYRSLEANNGRAPKLSKKQIHFMEESLEVSESMVERDRSRERPTNLCGSHELLDPSVDPQSKRERLRKSVAQFERRSSKSLPKKRREALRERQASLDTALSAGLSSTLVGVGCSLEGDATPSDEISGKRSVLARFLRTHRYPAAHYRLLQRDYSIDEKSDRLFKEFSRTEVPQEWEPPTRRGTRLYTGRRLHRHLDAEGSPRSHRRKLSPQDSIEEEDQVAAALWESEISRPESLADSIGLPEETE
ncbi:uro-adherence factor A-like [Macrobrachium rosenbergii]|uniref:uro-adherence factor A-like n=1 Tax=Macrobrachium rosenbergii TaxID=79674 RepID=UPI0034D674EF